MIIDSHQHVFWHGRDDAGLVADMDTHGIDTCWLLTWEIPHHPVYPENFTCAPLLNPSRVRTDGSHPGVLLEDLLIARDRHPNRFVVGYCPDPQKPNAAGLFEAAVRMHGVRVCGEWKFRMLFDDPRSLEIFHAAGRCKAPVVLHLDVPHLPPAGREQRYIPGWYGGTMRNLERALEECPETTFVGHAPGFWREISTDADECAQQYPKGPVVRGGRIEQMFERFVNLYADLSAGSALQALKRDTGYTKEFLGRFSGRLLFARDYYGGELLEFLRGLDLPSEVMEQILHRNARALVKPNDPSADSPVLMKLG